MDALFVAVGLDEGVKNERAEVGLGVVLGADDKSELGSCVSFGLDLVEETLGLGAAEIVGGERDTFGTKF